MTAIEGRDVADTAFNIAVLWALVSLAVVLMARGAWRSRS